jgi:hypothetical protein
VSKIDISIDLYTTSLMKLTKNHEYRAQQKDYIRNNCKNINKSKMMQVVSKRWINQ